MTLSAFNNLNMMKALEWHFLKATFETVEKANFVSLVLLRDHNFLVCPIW